jgi:lipoate-protein ligase A
MANYLLVVLDQAVHQWLLSLPENQFDTWSDLQQAFIDNFIATYDQQDNKYDLERIHDRAGESPHDYIRRFSDMHLKIPRITHDEVVSAFIKGLRHHDTLRSKLLRKRSSTVSELLAIAKNYADADDAEKIIKEDVGGSSRLEHPPH